MARKGLNPDLPLPEAGLGLRVRVGVTQVTSARGNALAHII